MQQNSASQPIKGARDRFRAEPDATYAKHILEPIFEFNCRYNFAPLIAAHRAWLTMLVERNIVPRASAAQIFRALDDIEKTGPDACRPFDAALDFYYLQMERAITQRVPGGKAIVGNLTLARTRPEPLARTAIRDLLLKTLD